MHWHVMYSVPSTVLHCELGRLEQCSAFMHRPSTVEVRTIGSLMEKGKNNHTTSTT